MEFWKVLPVFGTWSHLNDCRVRLPCSVFCKWKQGGQSCPLAIAATASSRIIGAWLAFGCLPNSHARAACACARRTLCNSRALAYRHTRRQWIRWRPPEALRGGKSLLSQRAQRVPRPQFQRRRALAGRDRPRGHGRVARRPQARVSSKRKFKQSIPRRAHCSPARPASARPAAARATAAPS